LQTFEESTGCSRDLDSAALHSGYHLDLIHAPGYLSEAAPLFHPDDSDAARTIVKAQARRMLHGGGSAKPLRLNRVGHLKLGAKLSWTWGPL